MEMDKEELEKEVERLRENIGAALYELDLLQKKVDAPINSNVSNHFRLIKNWLVG